MVLNRMISLKWENLLLIGTVLLFDILTGCVSKETATLPAPKSPPVEIEDPSDPMAGRFSPGDVLELYVREDVSLNGNYPVRDGGYIVIPRAGRVPIQGLDRAAAESKLKEYLQRTQLTEATVLVERVSARYAKAAARGGPPGVPKVMLYITGSVAKSGVHYVPVPDGRQLGLYEAILVTGGFSKYAQVDKVEVMRADATGRKHRAVIDLRGVREGKDVDPLVGDGDIINVPEKVFGF
jgi:protein involved in polysaccharide export with SLBB domain